MNHTNHYRLECDECEGAGQRLETVPYAGEAIAADQRSVRCDACEGTGYASGFLCSGCDAPVDDGECANCAPTEVRGDPLLRRFG